LFLLFTVNLVLATCSFPFFSFGYPNALTYSLSPCSSMFFLYEERGSIMANTWTWTWLLCTRLCLSV
jgi:hypothetical protein